MNRKEGKKIAVMTAIMVGLMMFAFMPMASAGVTSFTVTPSTGITGAVQSYSAYVITDGVISINITIPMGFIAVAPTMSGEEIARLDFFNSSTKAYYGHAIITANDTNSKSNTVDIYWELGGDAITTTQDVYYAPGATTPFESGFGDGSSAIITLPTEDDEGSIKITINSTAFLLDAVMTDIKQFVRNPWTASDYVFSADGVDATVIISAPIGRGAVFRNGWWFADQNGDLCFKYGIPGDEPVVGDINNDGSDDVAILRNDGWWYVSNAAHSGTDYKFKYGISGDIPVVGDINNSESEDAAIFRDGWWYVSNANHIGTDYKFKYGIADDKPVVGDINNDGIDDVAIFRDGWWYVSNAEHTGTDYVFKYGIAGDKPVVGDIRGDGRNDVAILRNGWWYVSNANHIGTDYVFKYGIPGDDPVAGDI
jgi:hypothetical protein